MGQKNKIARRWARRGTRPRAPHDQRTSSVYIFGAICPQEGKGAALVLPRCDTPAMNLHLAEVAQAVAPGAHGVMLMDRAGWHRTKDLVVPDNLTLVLLPARSPELNPVENIWEFLRDNWLSSRVFASYRDIVDHCCDAWNRLIDQPWIIMSIGLRDWANASREGLDHPDYPAGLGQAHAGHNGVPVDVEPGTVRIENIHHRLPVRTAPAGSPG